ncbi:MAG: IS66 family transposase zinc-finger binding domain-containing protein [Holophagales bacterium]|nr:IS66 family transposase zinc-finger binding domain-containing protein [Holophagales bacterium]
MLPEGDDPFGEDVKLTLDYEPARITVVETVRVKYSCSKCHEGVVIAPVPDAVMDKGPPEAGMLAYVAVSKYADHLPSTASSASWPARGWSSAATPSATGSTSSPIPFRPSSKR